MKISLTVWTASSDADGGTQGASFATEREGEDWIIGMLDDDATREALDEILAGDPDVNFFDFVEDHRRDDLDTFNLESSVIEFDVPVACPGDPIIAPAEEPVLNENDPAAICMAGLDLLDRIAWSAPIDANNIRFLDVLDIGGETETPRVYRAHIIRES